MEQGRRRVASLALAVVLAVVAGGLAYAVTTALRAAPPRGGAVVHGVLRPGTTAPSIALVSLYGGRRVELTAFRGEPVVVNFFASWCANCRAELRAFARASRAETGRAHFLGVDSSDGQPSEARRLLRQAGARYPVGVDSNGSVASRYDVPGLPTTFVIDSRGKVVVELAGQLSFGALEHWIAHARPPR